MSTLAEIAGYHSIRELGRGGMGVVLLAEDMQLGRRAAIKILASDRSADETYRRRFHRESKIASAIDHPHILPVYAAGQSGETLYIVMRFVDGGDLGQLIQDGGPVPADRALTIIDQIASALDAAHSAGLIHRDVKPENILMSTGVDGADHCYISDFGLSKKAGSSSRLTEAGQVLGSIAYISPEIAAGSDVDHRCDVYSLGALAFHLLAGRTVFDFDRDIAVLHAHISNRPRRLSAVRKDTPSRVDAVLMKALAKNPDAPFASAGELARNLRSAFEIPAYRSSVRPAADLPYSIRLSMGIAAVLFSFSIAEALGIWLSRFEAFSIVWAAATILLIALNWRRRARR